MDNAVWQPATPYHILDPYFQIANTYGFANYMFQTNQGPSYPAHQFLLSGTSAPVSEDHDPNNCGTGGDAPCHGWFAAENDLTNNGQWGCLSNGANIWEVDPELLGEFEGIYTPPGQKAGFPCYDHLTLVDLLDGASPAITWKYYAREKAPNTDLWTAPNSIQAICQPSNGACTGQDWINNVAAVFPDSKNYPNDYAPILTDIAKCNLSQVSWVIPDGNWSDHAGSQNSPGDGGPSWVAAIVNAIGNSWSNSSNTCDYWGGNTTGSANQPTVILVVWDDWGGWYDDVVPPDCTSSPCTGYSNLIGKQYVYGFRVPLLVVGAYTNQAKNGVEGFTGYISGPPSNPICPSSYCHDFGSILNFVEYAFGSGGAHLGGTTGIGGDYPYADSLVMDTSAPPNNYSLYDFFNFGTNGLHSFQTIQGAKYEPSCFHTPTTCFPASTYPLDPDADVDETGTD